MLAKCYSLSRIRAFSIDVFMRFAVIYGSHCIENNTVLEITHHHH
jgi:hypothetical protein